MEFLNAIPILSSVVNHPRVQDVVHLITADPRITTAYKLVGATYIATKALQLAQFVSARLTPPCDLRKRYAAAGNWAVVTGGSEGIGYALANELAAKGFNVAIIALDEPLLYDAADRLRGAHPSAAVKAVPFNFLTADEASYARLFEELDKVLVAVLVNNVGGFYRYPKPFDAATLAEDLRLLRLNCEPQIRMTKHFLPRFKSLRCGGIVNLASYSALTPSPYLSVYAGTKAFNLAFARSLEAEVREFNIDVLSVTPLFVSTRITQGMNDSPMAPGDHGAVRADEMARDTVAQLGRTTQTCGHRRHEMIGRILRLLGPLGTNHFLQTVKARYAADREKEMKAARQASPPAPARE